MPTRRKRYYIGLGTSFHDPALAIVSPDGEILFAEAAERYMQDKGGYNCPPDNFLRMPELIKEYCEPDAELIAAVSCSELSLTMYQLGVLSDLSPFRALTDRFSEFVNARFEHRTWPFPTLTNKTALTRNAVFMASLNLTGNPLVRNPVKVRRYDHHLSHAAYACQSSPFEEAVCAVIDGFGERASTDYFSYRNGTLTQVIPSPAVPTISSLGFFYAQICRTCGFDPNKGEEWKVMGLAPYGKVDDDLYKLMRPLLKVRGLRFENAPTSEAKRIVGKLKAMQRRPEVHPSEAADIARTGQHVFCEVLREVLQNLFDMGISKNLVFTGGCALNSSWNGRVLKETSFERLHVPSAPTDDGNSVGAALLAYYEDHPEARQAKSRPVLSPYLGTGLSSETREHLVQFNTSKRLRVEPQNVAQETAKLLSQGKIIGWMQGRAEFGPRALGHRSILADPRRGDMKDRINARVKFREEYRPFAPSILHEFGPEYFENYQQTPYMDRALVFREEVRHKVPAVVHEDGTGRLQSVTKEMSGRFYELIRAFHDITGIPIVLNTSFNIMGKPIIHSIQDAVATFYTTGLDALVVDDIIIEKEEAS